MCVYGTRGFCVCVRDTAVAIPSLPCCRSAAFNLCRVLPIQQALSYSLYRDLLCQYIFVTGINYWLNIHNFMLWRLLILKGLLHEQTSIISSTGVPHALEGYVWEGDAVCVHVYWYGQLLLSSAASPFSITR